MITAAIADQNSPENLTSYALILRLISGGFYPQIINGLPALRIITIMLNALIVKDFSIFL
jgi:hypothetical protein